MKTYIGIDNGVTGAIVAVDPNENCTAFPVKVIDCGKDRILDVSGNLGLLREIFDRAGGIENVVVAYEAQKKNPLFGTKGNFANGRNGEFWRVLLTVLEIPFSAVYPDTWQHEVLKGIAGTEPKQKVSLYVTQRFPRLSLRDFNQSQQLGIRDALCIAMWARANGK